MNEGYVVVVEMTGEMDATDAISDYLRKSILVICQEVFEKDFDMFSLKKGGLHHRS